MNPTKQRNPGRRAARAFAAMALAATSFLVPAAAQAADEATTGPDAATDATAADASATTVEADASTEEGTPASSNRDTTHEYDPTRRSLMFSTIDVMVAQAHIDQLNELADAKRSRKADRH